jgi:prepilin-type N-terminal cleavage/methylation domain-containing protein
MKKNLSTQRGFSLVEVLVAVTLLLLVVTGPMTIMKRTANSTTFATEQATAFFLAQEALELVQLKRDDLVLDAFEFEFDGTGQDDPMNDFDTFFASCLGGNACGVTINSSASHNVTVTSPCGGTNIGNCALRTRVGVTSVRPIYVHGATGTLTPYYRTVKIERTPTTGGKVEEYKVTATVTWRTGSLISEQKVELVTYLENTYDNN